jgi:DNA-binding MarR family transcriptional regulator
MLYTPGSLELDKSVGFLIKRCGIVMTQIAGLERNGMVHRHRSSRDRRGVEIAITPQGRRAARTGKRLIVDLLNEFVAPYSKAEVDTLISLLQPLLLHLQHTAQLSTPTDP